ncbi:MAG TPA: hypothetical protein VEJ18_14740, partial [Planctomycetota bacterium]|nr:hypothetical protein [Planctomycetota bacterium]
QTGYGAQGYGQPGYGQPGMPPPAPLPIYYPPPPRTPLLKPDTVIFLKKLVVAFVILGTLFALVIVGMSSLARAIQSSGVRGQDAQIARQIRSLDPRIPLDERIQEAQRLLNKLPANDRTTSAQATADLMNQRAMQDLRNNQVQSAESYFSQAESLDPSNFRRALQLGKLYWDQAQSKAAAEKSDLLQQSGRAFHNASLVTSDPALRQQFGEQAARAFFEAARSLMQSNPEERSAVRDLLYNAREAAPPGSTLLSEIEAALNAVRQR